MPPSVIASAPGSLMLLGEHAVLYGKPAIVCAIDQRITVTLTPQNDRNIFLQSDLHGELSVSLDSITVQAPFQYVLQAIAHCRLKIRQGFHLHIASSFSDQIGFGSSAAVTVATLAAIYAWLSITISPLELVRQGRQIIQTVQGRGSGADVAASVYGGIVNYLALPVTVEKLLFTHPLVAIYSGYKTKTADVIAEVQARFANYPSLFRKLAEAIGQCTLDGTHAIRQQQWDVFGQMMTIQQGLMSSLGVNTRILQAIVDDLLAQPTILGAKISGAGLGDCVIGLGELASPYQSTINGVKAVPVAMSLQGVQHEKN